MGQRLVRAKNRIREAGVPFEIPEREELPQRLAAVLDAVYAAYTKGWNELSDGVEDLADEAIWLARLIVSLLPDEPEAKGMLALMLYTAARAAARRDAAGAYVPLDSQDTGLWDTRAARASPKACCATPALAAPPAATSSRPRSSPPTPPAG